MIGSIIITGGSGRIGVPLQQRLVDDGHSVFAPTRAALDLRAQNLELPPADLLIHAAASRHRAMPGPDRLASEIEINVLATARLYAAAARAGVRSIIHLSTVSVFRESPDVDSVRDESAPRVGSDGHPYGLTKAWGEDVAEMARASFETVMIVRPSLVIGPGFGATERWATAIRAGQQIPIAAPRGHRYAPVFIDDVVDALARFARTPSNTLVNLAGPDALLEADMLADVARVLGRDLVTVVEPDERPVSLAVSTAHLDALLPGRVRTHWARALAVCLPDPAATSSSSRSGSSSAS